jgi:hypothetical protein
MKREFASTAGPGVSVTVVEVGETPETQVVRLLGPQSDQLQPADMAAMLRACGLAADYVRVDSTAAAGSAHGFIVLVQPDEGEVTALPASLRSRTIAVTAVTHEQQRDWTARCSFLGLVSSRTWTHWAGGMMGATGVFGQLEIADAAGLVLRAENGALEDPERRLELPELLARYLAAAGLQVPGPGKPAGQDD